MLAKKYRISKDKEFQNIYKKGHIIYNPFFNIKFLPNNLRNSRFGIVISTKISKKAVVRNKSRRQIKAVICNNLNNIKPGFDIVVLTKPAITTANQEKISQTLISLLIKAKIYIK